MVHDLKEPRGAVPTNIRLECKFVRVTNGLAYYNTDLIMTVKSSMILTLREIPTFLPTNSRLRWRFLRMTNTLAFYDKELLL